MCTHTAIYIHHSTALLKGYPQSQITCCQSTIRLTMAVVSSNCASKNNHTELHLEVAPSRLGISYHLTLSAANICTNLNPDSTNIYYLLNMNTILS